ncbi:MAG TPA: hypothetical protein VFA56_02270 [Gaiellaceae bacterium]|nr:hypothetical protein [Gaiellaceae bacterium]
MRGWLAGALAAGLWQASDPILKRTFDTPYSDAQLLGPFITRGRYEWLADLGTHCAGGALFGHLFERFGGRGVKAGVAAALVENTLLWPGLAVFDRIHPKRRDGTWPPLVTSPNAFACATAGHAFFGVVLGVLTEV